MKKISFLQVYILTAVGIALVGILTYTLFTRIGMRALKEDVAWNVDTLQESIQQQYAAADGDAEAFFWNASYLMTCRQDLGDLLILDDDFAVVRPDYDAFQQSQQMLIMEFAAAIRNGTLQGGTFFTTADGGEFYVNCVRLSPEETGFRYVIVYKEISLEMHRVHLIAREFRVVCFAGCLLLILLMGLPTLIVTRSMRRLNTEVARIAPDNLAPIVFSAPVRDTEQLRVSLNEIMEKIQASYRQKGNTLRYILHALRNSFTAVGGFAQGIELGVADPGTAASAIQNECRSMSSMMDNLSMLSYLGSHQEPEAIGPLPVADAAEDCIKRFTDAAAQKGVAVVLHAPDRSLAVKAAPELFDAVLSNLLSNAIRYAGETVDVSLTREGDLIRISVADDGEGISERDMPHIFEEFYKGRKGQSGIGLAVAQKAAESLGGSLTAENRPEGGALFTFTMDPAAGV